MTDDRFDRQEPEIEHKTPPITPRFDLFMALELIHAKEAGDRSLADPLGHWMAVFP